MNQPAQQGHAYNWRGEKVIALASGPTIKVARINDGWLGQQFTVDAVDLEPVPMRYFHGETP